MRELLPRPIRRLARPLPLPPDGPAELVLTLSPGPDGSFVVHARSGRGEAQGRLRLPWSPAGRQTGD